MRKFYVTILSCTNGWNTKYSFSTRERFHQQKLYPLLWYISSIVKILYEYYLSTVTIV